MVKMADWGEPLKKIAKKRTFESVGFALKLCCDCGDQKILRNPVENPFLQKLENLGFFS